MVEELFMNIGDYDIYEDYKIRKVVGPEKFLTIINDLNSNNKEVLESKKYLKIIKTTDSKLLADGVPAFSKQFLNELFKNEETNYLHSCFGNCGRDYLSKYGDNYCNSCLRDKSEDLVQEGNIYFSYEPNLAEKKYKEAIEINPKFVPAYKGLGYLYLRRDWIDKAISVFEDLEKIQPQCPEKSYRSGYIMATMNALKRNIDVCERIMSFDGNIEKGFKKLLELMQTNIKEQNKPSNDKQEYNVAKHYKNNLNIEQWWYDND